jgi:hypothetical protein
MLASIGQNYEVFFTSRSKMVTHMSSSSDNQVIFEWLKNCIVGTVIAL